MRTPALLTAMMVVVGACAAPAGDSTAGSADEAAEVVHNALTPEEVAAGWILLFDGVSTDGWRGYLMETFPEAGWAVGDGNLIVFASDGSEEGLGGDIITEREFTDFELVFDFNISPVGNSGVFYRVKEHEGEVLWQVAPEYQVIDDTAYIEMGTIDMYKHLTGDNYDLHPSRVTASNPIGEWNTGRIVVDGTHVEHWLNGQMTVEYDYLSDEWEELVAASKFADSPHYGRAPSGSIGIQDHGHELRYRNIKIRPLNVGG